MPFGPDRVGTAVVRCRDTRSATIIYQHRAIWQALKNHERSYVHLGYELSRCFLPLSQIVRLRHVSALDLSYAQVNARIRTMRYEGLLLAKLNVGPRHGEGFMPIPDVWPTQFQTALQILQMLSTSELTIYAISKRLVESILQPIDKTIEGSLPVVRSVATVLEHVLKPANFVKLKSRDFKTPVQPNSYSLTSDGFLELTKYESYDKEKLVAHAKQTQAKE